jgi:hypothetical protein
MRRNRLTVRLLCLTRQGWLLAAPTIFAAMLCSARSVFILLNADRHLSG